MEVYVKDMFGNSGLNSFPPVEKYVLPDEKYNERAGECCFYFIVFVKLLYFFTNFLGFFQLFLIMLEYHERLRGYNCNFGGRLSQQ